MTRIKNFLASDKVYRFEMLFKIVYILHLLASFNPYIESTPIVKVTLVGTMLLGGFMLLCRLGSVRLYWRTPGLPLLLLFIVSFAIPSLLIYRYALTDSLKTIIWMAFQFCLLFAFSTEKEAPRAKRELGIVAAAIALFITLENLVSVIMAFTGFFHLYEKFDGVYAITGLAWWGRLYGVHGDPNYACVYTIAAIMICVYAFIKCRAKWLRITALVAAVINFMFVSFSASRTGLVCLIVAVAVFLFAYMIGHFRKKAVLKSAIVAVAACFALVGLNSTTIATFNEIKSMQHGGVLGGSSSISTNEDDPTIGRTEEEMQGDPTNRRGDIWGSALQIFSKNAVFGIGFENVLGYAHDKMPTTYIVNNDQTDFDAFHNTVMDVLVSQGAVGILLAGAFAVLFVIYCIKRMRRQYGAHREELCLCMAICVSALASAMFLSHIFYVNIASTGIFWLFAGYLGYFLYAEE